MDKYRKIYNENFLGTSDVSILKFYYASFKIQQGKGKVADAGGFLNECIEIAADTAKFFKVLGYLPFVNSKYGTEQERISKFIKLRRNDIETLFLQDDISDKDIEELLYGINQIPENKPKTDDYFLEKTKEKILKCYSIKGKKQLGDRIFGYLLKSEALPACSRKDLHDVWHNLLGKKIKPSNDRLFVNPDTNGSQNNGCTRKLIKDLYQIRDFYDDIGLTKVVRMIDRDIENTPKKP